MILQKNYNLEDLLELLKFEPILRTVRVPPEPSEPWYDIYGLLRDRDSASIEGFLSYYSNRAVIEVRTRDVITLIPDISEPEKHNLFRHIYAMVDEANPASGDPLAFNRAPPRELERVRVDSLREAIRLGVSRPDRAFSLYIRCNIRQDLRCLMVHFTYDGKVVLGVSVEEKDEQGQDNLSRAESLREEMEEVLPIQASCVAFEWPAPDSEQEFRFMQAHWDGMDEGKKDYARQPVKSMDQSHGLYYRIHRDWLHRQYRLRKVDVLFIPNTTDYFTLSDNQGRILNTIKSYGRHYTLREVKDPNWVDLARLPFLGFLLQEASAKSGKDLDFVPARVHKVSLPPGVVGEVIGDRTYQGLRASEVVIKDTYSFSSLEDLSRLDVEGFFPDQSSYSPSENRAAFLYWVEKHRQTDLYLAMLQEKSFRLNVDLLLLLRLVGLSDWPRFLSCLKQFEDQAGGFGNLLIEMCEKGPWKVSQVLDVLRLRSQPSAYYDLLLPHARHHSPELFQFFFSRQKKPLSLSSLAQGIMYCLENRFSVDARGLIPIYLEKIEQEHGQFCHYPIIRSLAVLDGYEEVLRAVLRLLPEEARDNTQLLNIALAAENEDMLRQLLFSEEDKDRVMREEVAFLEKLKEKAGELMKKAILEARYYQVAYLAPRLPHKDLVSPMVEASKEGMLGTVKLLVEVGHAAPDSWTNFPIKFANKGGFRKLKHYLLSKGVRDEWF